MKTILETVDGIKICDGVNQEHIKINNYFYVDMCDATKLQHLIDDGQLMYCGILKENSNIAKFGFTNNFERTKIKFICESLNVKTYELDFTTPKRYMIDNPQLEISPENSARTIFYDIETDDRRPVANDISGKVLAETFIISIAYTMNDGTFKLYIENEDRNDPIAGEKAMLLKHLDIIEKYGNVLVGWKSRTFDDTYIRQRLRVHKLKSDKFEAIQKMDLYEIVKKHYRLPKYSLKTVCETYLDNVEEEGKTGIIQPGNGNIYNAWMSNDPNLEKYNIMDTVSLYNLDKKLELLNTYFILANIVNCPLSDTRWEGPMVDMFIIRNFKKHKNNILVPTKPSEAEVLQRRTTNEGGYCFCYNPGIHENVYLMDFKSFYPTMMASTNCCPTTFIADDQKDIHKNEDLVQIPYEMSDGTKKMTYYKKNDYGILSNIIYNLIEERDKYKYKEGKINAVKSSAIKVLANSIYGVFSDKKFRYYNLDIANSITGFCRTLMKRCIKLAEDNGFVVIQGDTDSMMIKALPQSCNVTIEQLSEKCKELFEQIKVEFNMPRNFIAIEIEENFKRMISIMKKNYAYINNDDKITIKGLQCIKSSTNPYGAKMQRELIENILTGKYELVQQQSRAEITESINTMYHNLNSGFFELDHLIMKTKMGNKRSDYDGYVIDSKTGMPKIKKDGTTQKKSIPCHVKLYDRLEKKPDIGDYIEYVIVSTGPNVAATIEEYKRDKKIDLAYYLEKFLKPMLKVLVHLKFNFEEKEYDPKLFKVVVRLNKSIVKDAEKE
jgi:DNA polymerase I